MTTQRKIESEIAALPPNLQAEVLDFMKFVRQRHGLPLTPAVVDTLPGTDDSALYRAMEEADLIGCIETNEQLSTTYKNRLDFSAKHSARP